MRELYESLVFLVQDINSFLDLLIEFLKDKKSKEELLKAVKNLIFELKDTESQLKGGKHEFNRRVS